jgi:hypothetical protein
MSTVDVIVAALAAVFGLLKRISDIWAERETLTPEEAQQRIKAAWALAEAGNRADEEDLRGRIGEN